MNKQQASARENKRKTPKIKTQFFSNISIYLHHQAAVAAP